MNKSKGKRAITRSYVGSLREWTNEHLDIHNNRPNNILIPASFAAISSIGAGFIYIYNNISTEDKENMLIQDDTDNTNYKHNKKSRKKRKKEKKKINNESLISFNDDSINDDINTEDMSASSIDSDDISDLS